METVNLLTSNFGKALSSFVANLFIIEYGIVQKVVAEGVVEVQLSVVIDTKETKIITCPLLNIASNAFTLNIKPEIGDKVLVLFPRRFSPNMFEADSKDVVIDKNASSYSLFGSFAILLNQYKKGKHKNVVEIEKGNVDVKLSFDENKNESNINFKTTKDGDFEFKNPKLSTNISKDGDINVKNDKITLDMLKDGNISLKNEKITTELKNDGNIKITNGNATVTIAPSGKISINADKEKLEIKNSTSSIKDIITEIINTLDKFQTAGSPANHTAVPGQTLTIKTKLDALM